MTTRRLKPLRSFIIKLFVFVSLSLFYCEYIHYYVVIGQCSWPQLEKDLSDEAINAMVVADTHLLGSRNGHWFDKLRREWQMCRAFLTAVFLHSPDVVIFLGDLFDEGKWSSSEEFADGVKRFSTLFALPKYIKLLIVPGNHDMGFHYSINPFLAGRFERAFNVASVSAVEVRGIVFVLLNSMAMHGDSCFLCEPAQRRLRQLAAEFKCQQPPCPATTILPPLAAPPPRPVLLQHYPLFRANDVHCNDSDAAPFKDRAIIFRERWECLSKDASEEILSTLRPRLVLSGHTHFGCTTQHRHPPLPSIPQTEEGSPVEESDYEADYYEQQRRAAAQGAGPTMTIPEINVPSFSWRNHKSPTFAMVRLTRSDHAVYKCAMPREQTVVLLYCVLTTIFVITLPKRKLWWLAHLKSLFAHFNSSR